MVCDADSSYMCNAIPYLGKGTVELPRGTTHEEYCTLELTKPYIRKGRTVMTDNWFSSLPLALELRKCGMEFVSAIRQKSHLPKELMSIKLEKGNSVAVYNYNNVTFLSHQDSKNKRVQLLSTIHHRPTVVEKVKMDVQMFYNATKGGVNTFDRLCSSATCCRKTRRWPLSFFYGIINLAITNSHIIHQH